MLCLAQWTTPQPGNWEAVAPSAWTSRARRAAPAVSRVTSDDDLVDSTGAWIYALNVQGVVFDGYDHYAVEDIAENGLRVTVWNDDDADTLEDERYGMVWEFLPLAPDPDKKGAYNTRQTVAVYAAPLAADVMRRAGHVDVKSWDDFPMPHSDQIGHGVWVSDDLARAHRETRAVRGWRTWLDDVPAEEIEGGHLRDQRAAGRYAPSEKTITFYQSDLPRGGGVHALWGGTPNTALMLGTGPVGTLSVAIPANNNPQLAFCFVASTTDPSAIEENDWPAGEYRCQFDVNTAAAGLTYGLLTIGAAAGHFARVNTGLTADLETWVQSQPAFTGTGLKLASSYKDPTSGGGGSNTDRFECLLAVNNSTVGDLPIGFNVNGPDAFADGPWTSKPVSVAIGSFVVPSTAVVTTEIAVTGLGFTPSAILTFWNGTDSLTTTHGRRHYYRGQGFAVSPTERCCGCVSDRDTTAGSAGVNRHRNDSIVCVTESTGLGNPLDGGLLDLDRMTNDGFVCVVDEQFTGHAGGDRSIVVMYVAIGGPGVANATRFAFVEPAATGTQEELSIGFEPSIIFNQMFGWRGVDQNDESGDEFFTTGAAVRGKSAVKQFLFGTSCEDSSNPSKTFAYGFASEFSGFWEGITEGSGNLLNFRSSFTRMMHLGFRANVLERNSSRMIDTLCLNGGNWEIGTITTRTDTNDIVVSGLGFAPKVIIFMSVCRAESTQDTSSAHSMFCVGLSQGPSKQMSMTTLSKNGVTTNEVSLGVDYANVYTRFSTADNSIVGRMTLKSIEPGGFICAMSDADPDAAMIQYIALGLSDEKPFRATMSKFPKTRMRSLANA